MDQVHIGPRGALQVTPKAFGLEESCLECPVESKIGTHSDDNFCDLVLDSEEFPDTQAAHGGNRRKLCGEEGEPWEGCMSGKLVLPAIFRPRSFHNPAVWGECASVVLDWSAP